MFGGVSAASFFMAVQRGGENVSSRQVLSQPVMPGVLAEKYKNLQLTWLKSQVQSRLFSRLSVDHDDHWSMGCCKSRQVVQVKHS